MDFPQDECCDGVETVFMFGSAALVDAAFKRSKRSERFGVVGDRVVVGVEISIMVYVVVSKQCDDKQRQMGIKHFPASLM